MIVIHAYFDIKPEKRERFLEQIQPLIKSSKAEEGNITYHLYEDTKIPTKFIMVEEWKDEAAVEFHNNTDEFIHFGSISSEFFVNPVKVYQFAVSKKN
ncbi:hypothetical protein JCM9140_1134 [Halalkalibacter wakoensis JCM 9140]|uniref:ABM domain-containing protein n=1 Tax=Halalkalibacter wakoensis JCM 9140 TaxID=1236970 RepID=W4PZJ2_9BACI|nr:putative quinol monooxygenase [Halalkalibacter wakoensis]GAE25157.1 hypothetical protein JCM9140_1134 [Halalkalibacter wakoensis JCM 9140]